MVFTENWFLRIFQFKPLEQLMGVFPAASQDHVPPAWRSLMYSPVSSFSKCDQLKIYNYGLTFEYWYFSFALYWNNCVLQESSIIDFYPTDFKIDLNGKKYAWQGVALLPFVEEKRLWEALGPVYEDLTQEEGNQKNLVHRVLLIPTKKRQGNCSFNFFLNI